MLSVDILATAGVTSFATSRNACWTSIADATAFESRTAGVSSALGRNSRESARVINDPTTIPVNVKFNAQTYRQTLSVKFKNGKVTTTRFGFF